MNSPTLWIAESGEGVSVGDYVALNLNPDSVGLIVGVCPDHGLPRIKLTEGVGTGRRVTAWPAQILMKVHR